MRRMAVILALLATGGLLVACGSSSHPAATTVAGTAAATGAHAAAATGAPAGASGTPTKAQALAFARAVNLRATDVPGFHPSSQHEHETAAEKRLEHEMLRCVGALGSNHGIAEASSKDFERETNMLNQSVQSEVSVARTSTLAAKELAAIRSNHVRACLSHYLDLLFKSQKYQGATVSPVSISQGTPPAPGTTGSFAWRITTMITVRGIGISVYIDILGFVYGPAEVTLFTSGVPQPFPAATEERLFSQLLTRAKTHGV